MKRSTTIVYWTAGTTAVGGICTGTPWLVVFGCVVMIGLALWRDGHKASSRRASENLARENSRPYGNVDIHYGGRHLP